MRPAITRALHDVACPFAALCFLFGVIALARLALSPEDGGPPIGFALILFGIGFIALAAIVAYRRRDDGQAPA